MTVLAADQLAASTAVRLEGRLLTPDVLAKLTTGDRELPGCAPTDYGLARTERLGDAAGRAWQALRAAYRAFRDDLASLPDDKPATSLTRNAWLRRLFTELGYGPLTHVGSLTVRVGDQDKKYAVSHRWQDHLPLHLLAWGTDLDRRVGAAPSPQSLMQELLNTSSKYLWGILTNGKKLRLLRDSTTLVRSSYVEFDLETIFETKQYSDFVLLYALLHASRFELVAKPAKKRRRVAAEDAEAEGAEVTEEAGTESEAEVEAADLPAALTPADCRIEWLRAHAQETGTRARDRLRDQVEQAINVLGTGFLTGNPELRDALARGGHQALEEYHHELLRLAYQLIFLFVAEDRNVLLDPSEDPRTEAARDAYTRYFSTRRLRRIAARRHGDGNTDLWQSLVLVLDALGTDGGAPELALPELGGLYLRAEEGLSTAATLLGSAEPLRRAQLRNDHLLAAVRLLSRVPDARGRMQRVDYRHLGADELGSVYESLLELVPRRDAANGGFYLHNLPGNKRKTTGAYYTPTVLIEKLLDNALDPVIARFEKAGNGNPRELLKINLVDPACGSGHVLVAAARRIALRFAQLETDDVEPPAERVREAMSLVVRNCVHGVDINPLAVEIAKVSLWLESLDPGQPLAFLDDRLKVGNALLGVTPKLLAKGLPNGAFTALKGDDKALVNDLRKQNRIENSGGTGHQQTAVFEKPMVRIGTAELRVAAEQVGKIRPRGLQDIREQARRHREFERSLDAIAAKRVADAWCAAFLWPKNAEAPPAITSATLQHVERMGMLPGVEGDASAGERVFRDIVDRNRFFHWHLEFPRVFRVEGEEAPDHNPDTGWQGGFDCVVGNPPWEQVKLWEKEWFATRDERISDALNASVRKRLIAQLEASESPGDQETYASFQAAVRESSGMTKVLRGSGIFPLTGFGDVNTYAVFSEKSRMLLGPQGMSGLVVPTGIATDKTTSAFFGDLIARRQVVAVLDFENEERLFADVHNQYRFCFFVTCGPGLRYERVRLAFRARRPDQLEELTFFLSGEDFERVNPNTRTAPVCDGSDYLGILLKLHRHPVLWRKLDDGRDVNPWQLRFEAMFHMAADSGLFQTAAQLAADGWSLNGAVFERSGERALPLFEGKMVHHYDSRFATYENATEAQLNKGTLPRLGVSDHANPGRTSLPRYWVREEHVEKRLGGAQGKGRAEWVHGWMLGRRNVCRASDERTLILSVLPRAAAGDKLPLILPGRRPDLLLACLSSRILDFAVRQKHAGISLSYFVVEQLPVLTPEFYRQPVSWLASLAPDLWIRDRVLELTYTSYDLSSWARDLGDDGAPFIWDEERRFIMQAELDAAYAHFYELSEEEVALILDSFRAFRNTKPELFERTREEILLIYGAMRQAARAGAAYVHPKLDPAPAHGVRHPPGSSSLTLSRSGGGTPEDNGLFKMSEIGADEQLGLWA
ncbi:Eco57I restriction-modification methylase domain-containing protein [Streptomyces millisiae]|uniref:site-specific DNA-methyltransferase (adenine-specific) n=1 Tax=Streptomyces millisiae TaxID=3075542 RepID=A0ABU2LVG2_9ACTN|nr:DNA methyltransferase [Streptomyces sp. DSM 44918]MDT0321556.1 DNA methyltransferase [Streptomyces sp. DSM 44918]